MIDIHSHVIPGVDDGSKTLETSLSMIRDEIANGVTSILCTPHHYYHKYQCSIEEIKHNFDLLNDAVKKENLPINLYLGMEIYYSHREPVVELLKQGKLLTLNNSKKVLLEFSFHNKPEDFDDIIYYFFCAGYKVIVAHVERYDWITYNDILYLRNEGAEIQINSASILGLEGFKRKLFVKKLLKHNLVNYIASDIHSFRSTTMAKAYKKIKNPSLFEYDGSIQ